MVIHSDNFTFNTQKRTVTWADLMFDKNQSTCSNKITSRLDTS